MLVGTSAHQWHRLILLIITHSTHTARERERERERDNGNGDRDGDGDRGGEGEGEGCGEIRLPAHSQVIYLLQIHICVYDIDTYNGLFTVYLQFVNKWLITVAKPIGIPFCEIWIKGQHENCIENVVRTTTLRFGFNIVSRHFGYSEYSNCNCLHKRKSSLQYSLMKPHN